MIELPLIVKSIVGKEEILKVEIFIIDPDVTYLRRKKTIENWGSKLDTV